MSDGTRIVNRTPNTYTTEEKEEAHKQLHDETREVMHMSIACILLDIGLQPGYALARKGEFPGAKRIGDSWKVSRSVLKEFLYGTI